MSLDDELSLSFASSMGIENIQDEYLDHSNLYTDLDQLERSVDAEFEEYMNRARSFPFKESKKSLEDASIHSDYEILGEELLDQENENAQDDSWQRYLNNKQPDEHYNEPFGNTSFSEAQNNSRSTSPGEYFGARSLPFNHDWQKQIEKKEELEEQDLDCTQSSYSSKDLQKNAIEKSLDSRFISLPKSLGVYPKYELPEIELHHPYTQKKTYSNGSSVSSTRQQCASREQQQKQQDLQQQLQNAQSDNSDYHGVRSLSNSHSTKSSNIPNAIYSIEPSSHLHFLCEISPKTIYAKVIHLKLRNLSSTSVRKYSLFAAKNMLDFETTEGLILEHEVVEVKIKIRSSTLAYYQRQLMNDEYPSLSDKVLVLIDHQYVNELDVNIDFMALEDEGLEEEEEEEEEEAEEEDEEDEEEQEEEEEGKDVIVDDVKQKDVKKEQLDEEAFLLANRPKCRFCALEKGYPLYNL